MIYKSYLVEENIENLKNFSKASYEINDTNLVDKNAAENLLKIIFDTNNALSEEVKKKKYKTRKRPKFKSGTDLYDQYIDSVVFIGNLKNNRLRGMGSGFIIYDKRFNNICCVFPLFFYCTTNKSNL